MLASTTAGAKPLVVQRAFRAQEEIAIACKVIAERGDALALGGSRLRGVPSFDQDQSLAVTDAARLVEASAVVDHAERRRAVDVLRLVFASVSSDRERPAKQREPERERVETLPQSGVGDMTLPSSSAPWTPRDTAISCRRRWPRDGNWTSVTYLRARLGASDRHVMRVRPNGRECFRRERRAGPPAFER